MNKCQDFVVREWRRMIKYLDSRNKTRKLGGCCFSAMNGETNYIYIYRKLSKMPAKHFASDGCYLFFFFCKLKIRNYGKRHQRSAENGAYCFDDVKVQDMTNGCLVVDSHNSRATKMCCLHYIIERVFVFDKQTSQTQYFASLYSRCDEFLSLGWFGGGLKI